MQPWSLAPPRGQAPAPLRSTTTLLLLLLPPPRQLHHHPALAAWWRQLQRWLFGSSHRHAPPSSLHLPQALLARAAPAPVAGGGAGEGGPVRGDVGERPLEEARQRAHEQGAVDHRPDSFLCGRPARNAYLGGPCRAASTTASSTEARSPRHDVHLPGNHKQHAQHSRHDGVVSVVVHERASWGGLWGGLSRAARAPGFHEGHRSLARSFVR